MCKYCNTSNYRKIYENHIGIIPKDDLGRSYEIHHVDGNRDNNNLSNLKCVSLKEHFMIHLEQCDWWAALRIAQKMRFNSDDISKFAKLNSKKINKIRKENGECARVATLTNRRRVKDGTHNFLNKEDAKNRQEKRVNEGTHNFLGITNNLNRIKAGTHNVLKIHTCNKCGKIGKGPGMLYHIKKCKSS